MDRYCVPAFRNNNDSRAVNLVTNCVLDSTTPHTIFVNDSGTNESGNYDLNLVLQNP